MSTPVKGKKKFKSQSARASPPAPYPNPYVVRFGPWARNLYLGIPVLLTFSLIGVVADMPWYVRIFWFGMLGVMAAMCLFRREVRLHAGDRVVVMWRFLALLPIWKATYPMTAFKSIKGYYSEYSMTDSTGIDAHTIYLELKNGKFLPVQSYSSGASDNQPPVDDLMRDLPGLTNLPVLQRS